MSNSFNPNLLNGGSPLWSPAFPGQDLDTFTIGTDRTPGQCTLKKAPNLQKWQVRDGNALSGATVVPMGEDVNDVEFDLYFWDIPDQLDAWKVFAAKWLKKAVVTSPGGQGSLALTIGYPILAMPPISVTKVVYVSCTELQVDDYDGYSCTVTFKKWRPPMLAPSRPSATIPSAQNPQPTAQDQAQALIQQQQGQISGLADQLFGPPPTGGTGGQ